MWRPIFPLWLVFICSFTSPTEHASAQDDAPALSYAEESSRDLVHWRELLAAKNYDELERISRELRIHPGKYRNGRGRDWRFYWTPLSANSNEMQEEDFERSFKAVEGWLKAVPDSVSARLAMAHLWHKYAFFARGDEITEAIPEKQLEMFATRNQKAAEFLDEIAKQPSDIDNVYRRLRLEIAKGLGKKPDVQLVYDALKSDPLNMELVHGMTICLLPRWFGEPGELETFADEVVRRTEKSCGNFQYITVVLATKEILKEYVLQTHQFDLAKIREGFLDVQKTYPQAREYLDDEAQLQYLSGDVAGAISTLQKIGDQPNLDSWKNTGINHAAFLRRVTRELTEGDQFRIIVGATKPFIRLSSFDGDKSMVTIDSVHGIRLYDFTTGAEQRWVWLQDINSQSAAIHPKTGLIAGGLVFDSGAILHHLESGRTGGLPTEKKVVKAAFSDRGDLLAIAEESGLISVIDLSTGEEKNRFQAETPRLVRALAFSPDAASLAITTDTGELQLLSLQGNLPVVTKKISDRSLPCVVWSATHLAVGGWNGEVVVFDAALKEQVAIWKPAVPSIVADLDFSPDGSLLAIGRTSDNPEADVTMPLSIWRHQMEPEPKPLSGHQLGVNCVLFMENGQTLVSGSHDWTLRYWKVK